MIYSILLLAAVVASDVTVLSSFDEAQGPVWRWTNQNDPVMGGASTSTFYVDDSSNTGVFNGTCAIVPFLGAPGFAKITTSFTLESFPDVSQYLDGSFQLRVRSSTPTYGGYKAAFR